jgi:hypothetical protein
MRSIRMAALAVAMTLMFSGFALARDHDQDNNKHDHWDNPADHDRHHDRDRDQDHERWQDRGHDRNRERLERDHHGWERDRRHDDGYYRGGQIYNRYPQNYPGGYGNPGGGVYGYPGGGYGYPGSVYGHAGNGRNAAYGFGYQDGSYMARRDISQNKRFNPSPRNEYGNRTHGYNSSFGDKNYYKSEYSSGYSAGYDANYRGGRGW